MKELEGDATGELHQEIAQIEEELREGVKDWAAYAVCCQLLRQAKEVYEKYWNENQGRAEEAARSVPL